VPPAICDRGARFDHTINANEMEDHAELQKDSLEQDVNANLQRIGGKGRMTG